MRAMVSAIGLLGLVGLMPGAAQAQDEVVVNGRAVTAEQVQAVQTRLGIPAEAQAQIPPGRYWYDPTSGLWGMEGGPALGQILPELGLGGPLQPDASGGGTNVFVNGREIHVQELLYLQSLFGYVNPGRYWLNYYGVGGYEGGPAIFDLRAAASAAGGGGLYGGQTRRTPFGGLGSDGNCSYYLHPNGSSVMNCG